jgi:hypothetical protein
MILYPAVIAHGTEDLKAAMRADLPITLISAPGAALYAGAGWWRALIALARREFPDATMTDLLDCADAPGRALEAIRIGQRGLVLSPAAPGFAAVAVIAAEHGGIVLPARPPALDLAARDGPRRLSVWLQVQTGHVDRSAPLG